MKARSMIDKIKILLPSLVVRTELVLFPPHSMGS